MKLILQIFLLLLLSVKGQSQNESIRALNLKYIDSIENQMKMRYCNDSLTYPAKYNSRKINGDKAIIVLLNNIYNDKLTVEGLNGLLLSIKKKFKVTKEENLSGLLTFSRITISGNYIRLELSISYIDDVIVRKHFYLNTLTSGVCDVSGINTKVLDYSLLRRLVATDAAFKIALWGNRYIFHETYRFDGLVSLSGKYAEYRFNVPSSSNRSFVNQVFYNQYNNDSSCCYSYQTADKYFAALVKNNEYLVIENLLYSPNYFSAVNAMEALVYLRSIGNLKFDDRMLQRMKALKEDKSKITIKKTNDFFSTVNGYIAINITDAMIIKKYSYIK